METVSAIERLKPARTSALLSSVASLRLCVKNECGWSATAIDVFHPRSSILHLRLRFCCAAVYAPHHSVSRPQSEREPAGDVLFATNENPGDTAGRGRLKVRRTNVAWLLAAGLTVTACRSSVPPVASPLAHGPPGPTPDIGGGPAPTFAPPAPISEDHAVAQSVRATLRSAIGSSAEKIHVSVRKGEVTLKGSLPASVDRQALLDQLEKLPGVDQIEDRLQVSR